ncbi:MAG: HAD hydrolase-like protein [Candidatus Margulisiibacteriota bacterium]|jgi:histidinol-phosphate phosphatase family protein
MILTMTILICSDRDGTINEDRNFYLGKETNWREQLEFLPGVIEGIRLLNIIPGAEFFIITNQPYIAVSNPEFSQVTEKRIDEVNAEIVRKLKKEGLNIKGVFACTVADFAYRDKILARGWKYKPEYVVENHRDLKPNIGMVERSAAVLGKSLKELDAIYVVGDRVSDVQTAINAGGKGVWVMSYKANEEKERPKVEALKAKYPDRVFFAEDFMDAARMICNDVKKMIPKEII